MTPEQYFAYLAGAPDGVPARKDLFLPTKPSKPRRESDLHQQILADCSRRNLVTFHGSMAHKSKRTLGEPDFIILLPFGRVLLLECKTATGQLREDQRDIIARSGILGHRVHIVRSFQEFHSALTAALSAGLVGANIHQQ